ncbi:hypothetical protein AALB39_27260, partial [Lachnospiraceae bacterium 54-53]
RRIPNGTYARCGRSANQLMISLLPDNYIAIPFFNFFVSACFMTILVNLFKIQVSQKTKRIYKMIDIVMATSYVLFLVLKMAGVIAIGNYPFISLYWTIFIAWGFIFTIDINSQIKESI